MKTNKAKIENLFPSVYITLISILLGFAVEDVISRLRELAPLDIRTVLTAVAILSAVFAAWTGYSFVSMTQERLPKLLDSVNVFSLAFGIYMLNSTLGLEVWWFFTTGIVYFAIVMFATIYNFNILLRNLNTSYSWHIFLPNVLATAACFVVYSIGAWMSNKGMLSPNIELSLIVYFFISNILWTYFFYHAWSKLIHQEA
jgi:hypothetical protein